MQGSLYFLDVPVKLYFDLDFYIELKNSKRKSDVLKCVIKVAIGQLNEQFGFKLSTNDVLILDSSSKLKFSYHLIFPSGTSSKLDQMSWITSNLIPFPKYE